MFRFLIKVTIFLLVGTIIINTLAYIAESASPNPASQFLQLDQKALRSLLKHSSITKAIAIGNSHTFAISFDDLDIEGFPIGRAGGDWFETSFILKRVIPDLKEVDTVFLPVSYFSFYENNAAISEREIRRLHLYASLPSWSSIEGDYYHFLLGKSLSFFPITTVVRQDNWKGVFYAMFHFAPAHAQNLAIGDEAQCQYMKVSELTAHARSRATEHVQMAWDLNAKEPELYLEVYDTLADTIQFLKERNIRVILFTPPYYEAYTLHYQDLDFGTIKQMKASIKAIQAIADIEYYDFSTDREISMNAQLFSDSDHLNRCGRSLFSKKLKDIIRLDR